VAGFAEEFQRYAAKTAFGGMAMESFGTA